MADTPTEPEDKKTKKSLKLPMLIGLLACLGGGAGGYVGYGFLHSSDKPKAAGTAKDVSAVAFVPIEQMIISLGRAADDRHLRFSAHLEVPKELQPDVAAMMPRILDVLNGYLRAVRLEDVEDPAALVRLRAQMLRRVQTVVGGDAVRDFLVTEFVVS